ncbi:MAG: tRNA lysidine(34) synthetase TilS, partial [Clostridiales bacterium]|nr:tRNA lysidine(34) synthetase TilS [Clostridiales bacterium]
RRAPAFGRPFNVVYPVDIAEYCANNNIGYVVDETNFIDDADRNFIRLNVIPLIEKRYCGAVRAINSFSRECTSVCDFLDDAIDKTQITYSDGAALVTDEALLGSLAARYVRRALGYFTTVDVTREQTERVVALAHMRIGATVELSGGIVAVHEYGRVALFIPRLECTATCPVATGGNFIDGLAVDITPSDASPRSVKGGAVDLDKLDGAVLRFRRDGDVFTPFGGKRKKLKQYFIDKKIPKRLRDRMPLICRGDEVLVIVGTEISEHVKQTAETKTKAVVRRRW